MFSGNFLELNGNLVYLVVNEAFLTLICFNDERSLFYHPTGTTAGLLG